MINYDCLKFSPVLFLTFTGLMPSEFEHFMPAFREAWKKHIVQAYAEKKNRKRKYGGGRKQTLLRDEDKLLFILFYFKIYPLQQVIAFLFGMSQGQACEWIHRLSAVVKQGLGNAGSLPERNPENLRVVLSEDGADKIIIDGTEKKQARKSGRAEKILQRKEEDSYRKKQCNCDRRRKKSPSTWMTPVTNILLMITGFPFNLSWFQRQKTKKRSGGKGWTGFGNCCMKNHS